MVRALLGNARVLQLDLRMCGASWADQAALESAVGANNAALRTPLPLRDMLAVSGDVGQVHISAATRNCVAGVVTVALCA